MSAYVGTNPARFPRRALALAQLAYEHGWYTRITANPPRHIVSVQLAESGLDEDFQWRVDFHPGPKQNSWACTAWHRLGEEVRLDVLEAAILAGAR